MSTTKDNDKKKQDHNAERKLRNDLKEKNAKRGERQYSKKSDHL